MWVNSSVAAINYGHKMDKKATVTLASLSLVLVILASAVMFVLPGMVGAYDGPNLNICICDSCLDCNDALADPACTEVQLSVDLDESSSCIQFSEDDKTLNCDDHVIGGDGSGRGVEINNVNGSKIQNCIIEGWNTGIYVINGEDTVIEDNTVGACLDTGISIQSDSLSTTLSNNIVRANSMFGIYMSPDSTNTLTGNSVCDNVFDDIVTTGTGNSGTENTCSSGDWSDTGFSDCEFPCTELCYEILAGNVCTAPADCECVTEALADVACSQVYLDGPISDYSVGGVPTTCVTFNANGKTFDCQGYRIDGIGDASGIVANSRSGLTINNCLLTDWGTGLEFTDVDSSSVGNVEVFSSSTGIALTGSMGNTLSSVTVEDSTQNGIYLRGSTDNTITAAYLNNNGASGILFGESSNDNTLGNSPSISSNTWGINMDSTSADNSLVGNRVCSNSNKDFFVQAGTPLGDNNICDTTANGWHDNGEAVCTYTCTEASDPTCSNCQECTEKLNQSFYPTVELTGDLEIPPEKNSCINITRDGAVFDCGGYQINASNRGTGILIDHASGVEVKDCTITNWYKGLSLESTTNSQLTGITSSSNTYGIRIDPESSSNSVYNSYFCGNFVEDVDNVDESRTTGRGNTCDGNPDWIDMSLSCDDVCTAIDVTLLVLANKNEGLDGNDITWTIEVINNDPTYPVDVVLNSLYLQNRAVDCVLAAEDYTISALTSLTPYEYRTIECKTEIDASSDPTDRGQDCYGADVVVTADITLKSEDTGVEEIKNTLIESYGVNIASNGDNSGTCETCGGEFCANAPIDCGSCPSDYFLLEMTNATAPSNLRFMLEHDSDGNPLPGQIAGVSFTLWEDAT